MTWNLIFFFSRFWNLIFFQENRVNKNISFNLFSNKLGLLNRLNNFIKFIWYIVIIFCYLVTRWRWWNCRFDGQDFLRRFKGKKIMYIGDSIGLNQWQSMLCLLPTVVPDQSIIFQNANGPITRVIFQVSQLCHPLTYPL